MNPPNPKPPLRYVDVVNAKAYARNAKTLADYHRLRREYRYETLKLLKLIDGQVEE
jgi:hypothetical protein